MLGALFVALRLGAGLVGLLLLITLRCCDALRAQAVASGRASDSFLCLALIPQNRHVDYLLG